MKILNKDEIDTWLFEHANIQGHRCDSIKGTLHGTQPGDAPAEEFNLAWVDVVTEEKIDVIYEAVQPLQQGWSVSDIPAQRLIAIVINRIIYGADKSCLERY